MEKRGSACWGEKDEEASGRSEMLAERRGGGGDGAGMDASENSSVLVERRREVDDSTGTGSESELALLSVVDVTAAAVCDMDSGRMSSPGGVDFCVMGCGPGDTATEAVGFLLQYLIIQLSRPRSV